MTISPEPKQPKWPMNVKVFNPTQDVEDIKAWIKKHTEDPSAYHVESKKMNYNSDNHFTTKHWALLFEPGEYKDCQFEVGYYVGMAGLGRNAKGDDAVIFTGEESGPFVPALNKNMTPSDSSSIPYDFSGLCLDTFWRSAENFTADSVQWAVSQAAPLRRVYIEKKLEFGDGGAYSSGGFLANAEVGGTVDYVANQQWFSRAVNMGNYLGGAWSLVMAGCTGKPFEDKNFVYDGSARRSVEAFPRVRMEKPFIVKTKSGDYELHVPKATRDRNETVGPHLDDRNTDVRCFSNVYVAKPKLYMKGDDQDEIPDETYNVITEEDHTITMNMQNALDEGKDLVLCPGIFFLTRPLVVKKKNQVILGLGLATLVAPQDGSPCIRVQANTPGVRVASVVLEGSVQTKSVWMSEHKNSDCVMSLIDFGEPDKEDPGDPTNPGLIADLFTRVGGSNLKRFEVKTDVMVRIFSGNVIGDNLWLWRADHTKLREGEVPNDPTVNARYWQVRNGEFYAQHALQVFGDNVSMYGLFAEHCVEEQIIWKGEKGSCSFFQCELPYDVLVDTHNYAGYHVDNDVKEHTAKGIGVYSNFTQHPVKATRGISVPDCDGVTVENPFTAWLNGNINSEITNVIQRGKDLDGGTPNKENKVAYAESF